MAGKHYAANTMSPDGMADEVCPDCIPTSHAYLYSGHK